MREFSTFWDTSLVSFDLASTASERHMHANAEERRFNGGGKKLGFLTRVVRKLAASDNSWGVVSSLASRREKDLIAAAREGIASADVISLEGPYLQHLLPRRLKDRAIVIYHAFSVEAIAASRSFRPGLMGLPARRLVRHIEGTAVRRSDIIIVRSEAEIDAMMALYRVPRRRFLLLPNGFDINSIPPCPGEEVRQFCRAQFGMSPKRPAYIYHGWSGSESVRAAEVVITELAPEFPHLDFFVAGHVCSPFMGKPLPANVKLLGWLDFDPRKRLIYAADGAINPTLEVDGNQAEQMDWMCAGLPFVTTPEAAQSLQLFHRTHALVLNRHNVIGGLKELTTDPDLRTRMASAAREHLAKNNSWASLANIAREAIETRRAPRLVILNDYQVHPAEQGGQVRIESVAKNLQREGINVGLLTLKESGCEERRQIAPGIEEINIPRTRLHRLVNEFLSKKVGCGANDVAALLFTRIFTREYVRAFREELKFCDGVMLSHPYMNAVTRGMRRDVPLFYDSHNTEYELKLRIYKAGKLSAFMANAVRKAEIDSATRSVATFFVSGENKADIAKLVPGMNGNGSVCPNGVDVSGARYLSPDDRRALRRRVGLRRELMAVFVGSGHPPNAEAARLIIDEMARYHARILFVIIGSVNGWFHNQVLPGNVILTGMVSTEVKNMMLGMADVALNPMLSGSGTSLKMMDYMAAGLPILSTPVGARGMAPEELEAIMILEPGEFNEAFRDLLRDRERLSKLSTAARRLAETRYDWSITLSRMTEVVSEKIGARR